MGVFLTGGTGLVGRAIVSLLSQQEIQPRVLTRNPQRAEKHLGAAAHLLAGDPTQPGDWMNEVDGCQVIINLAGENIFARRWNAAFKERLRQSRIRATRNLVQAIEAASRRPQVLLNASAIGYYGPQEDDKPLDESAPAGDDFLARLCVDWETEALRAQELGVRVVLMRLGIVLARDGGALKQMLLPFKMCLGGPVGSGRQWMSWIHVADVARAVLHAIGHESLQGPVNFTSPHPVRNVQFAQVLAKQLKRPSVLRTPAWLLRLTMGEVADVLATGQRVVPEKLMQSGFSFRFEYLTAALADLLGRKAASAPAR